MDQYEAPRMATAGRKLEEMAKLAMKMEEEGASAEHMKQMWAGQSNILVAVRVRPLLKHDVIKKSVVRVLDSNVVVILDPALEKPDILRINRTKEKQYAFDYVFEPGASQDSVYHHTTKFLIHGVLDGYNATVFAYGQTGSGKTHTMIGNISDPGIMVRVMGDLFTYCQKDGNQQGIQYKVTVSFLEVYNENIRDLLSDVEEYLDLREDPIKGPMVAGITEVETASSREIMDLLQQGNARRSQQATAANEVSSRSHAVLQVVVEGKDKAPGTVANIKVGKLSLVDLAGSERAANTQNRGARLVEGANINRSLLALGNCINALSEKGNKGNFVPYRDSKLTRLLKDSLGGNCRTVMIANISSAESSFEETLNTLKYANRAKNIKTNAQRNVLNVNYHISEYVHLIDNLRGEIKVLKEQIATQQSDSPSLLIRTSHGNKILNIQSPSGGRPPQPSTPLQVLRESLKSAASYNGSADRELVNIMRQNIVENFQERMQLRRSLIELEDQNVQNSIEVSKRQLIVVAWSESHGMNPGKTSQENYDDFAAHLLTTAEPDIKEAWLECEQLRKAIVKNNSMKKNIAKRLRQNEREAENHRKELNDKVTGEDRRELMELQYQVGRLELENMELEQHRIVHESIVKGKDLTIQKLMLQLAVRDKVIQRQQTILIDHHLDEKVGYAQLALMEQTLMGDTDLFMGSAPPSPPRSLNDLRPIDENLKSDMKKMPIVPLLNVSSVSKGDASYYEEYDDDEPPLTDIREIVLSSRDRGVFEAGEWSEIKSEISDIIPSPFESRKEKFLGIPSRGLSDIPPSNTNSANSFTSQEPVKGSRHQAGGVRINRQYRNPDDTSLVHKGKSSVSAGQQQQQRKPGSYILDDEDIESSVEKIDPPVSGRRLQPLYSGGSFYAEDNISTQEEASKFAKQFSKKKGQFDIRKNNGANAGIALSPRGQIMTSKQAPLQHVPLLQGIAKGGVDDIGQQLSARRQATNNSNSSLAVAGKGNQISFGGQPAGKAGNNKAGQLMKQVEDLYQGYQAGVKPAKDLRKKVDDSFVDDEFDESVDTIMSDNSDHSELTPRGDGVYKRRQSGPRGYGQGRVGSKASGATNGAGGGNPSKPIKYKLQGGQRPLKIAVKAANDVSCVGGPSKNDPIGMLIAQAYPNAVSAQPVTLLGGNNGEQFPNAIGAILLPVDKGNIGGMRNRSLPMLQQQNNNKLSNIQLQVAGH